MSATGRLGFDLEPNARVDVTRETLRRKLTLSAYNELAAVDEAGRHLGIGNSMMAAFFGKDDGDYYYRSGGALEWTPPTANRRTFRVRGYGEYHRAAMTESSFVLFRSWGSYRFRARPRRAGGLGGGRPDRPRAVVGHRPDHGPGGLRGDPPGRDRHGRLPAHLLIARLVVPMPFETRLGLEGRRRRLWGDPTPQRLWYVGGSRSLRGYDPLSLGGTSYLRARGELARTYSFGSCPSSRIGRGRESVA